MAITFKNLLNRGLKKMGYTPIRKHIAKRSYNAGKLNDLLSDFISQVLTPEQELRNLRVIRARSRDLCHNNDYARQFLRMVKDNVVGWRGIRLQMKTKNDKGAADTEDNRLLEGLFNKWGKKDTASVDGKLAWVDCQRTFIESVARDGEVFVRKVPFDNEFGFSLQFIDADHVDIDHNEDRQNGVRIRMGIEFDVWGRPVAYHVSERHPGDSGFAGNKILRIPADQMIHSFIPDRPNTPRGVPWMFSAMVRLKMLGGFEESEAVASRLGASTMGFIKTQPGEKYKGDDEDEEGNAINEVEPGTFRPLKPGQEIQTWDPQHPNSAFKDFVKAMLRGAASGLGVSYNTLANDLEGVNFSSIRSGKLEERDAWRCIQYWMIANFNQEVFSGGGVNFLSQALLVGPLRNIPFSRFEKFDAADWKPRGWDWVDPQKEVNARKDEIEALLTTRTRVVAEKGIDFEELLDEIVKERELMKAKGIELPMVQEKPPSPTKNENQDDEDNQ